MNLIQQLENEQIAELAKQRSVPKFQPGDTLRVNVKVVEGERSRIQAYEGVCIGRSGGELAAMVLLDAVIRLLPGVAGNEVSLADESFTSGLLEYPHYTRPREFEGREIPEVLLSGDHKRIADWRRKQTEALTKERRPDLWERYKSK